MNTFFLSHTAGPFEAPTNYKVDLNHFSRTATVEAVTRTVDSINRTVVTVPFSTLQRSLSVVAPVLHIGATPVQVPEEIFTYIAKLPRD